MSGLIWQLRSRTKPGKLKICEIRCDWSLIFELDANLPLDSAQQRDHGDYSNFLTRFSLSLRRRSLLNTYFFSRLPAPVSRNPLAKGLLSIFSCVICGRNQSKIGRRLQRTARVTHFFVLICSHSYEFGFLEHVRPEGRVRQLEDVGGSNQMESRLIFVHWVQNRLQRKEGNRSMDVGANDLRANGPTNDSNQTQKTSRCVRLWSLMERFFPSAATNLHKISLEASREIN